MVFLKRTYLAILMTGLAHGTMGLPSRVQADEPAEAFVRALRDNDYFDVAIDYLEQMKSSDLASPEFKSRIPFEMAEVYLDQAEQTRDVAQIESILGRADSLLQEFAASNPPAKLFADSAQVRAKALFARGKVALFRSQSDRATADEKRDALAAARSAFDQSLKIFAESLKTQTDLLQSFRIDPADPQSRAKREVLRGDFVKTRFMSPAIKEQIADTYPAADPQRDSLLKEAAAEYTELITKYARYPQGSFSRFAAARCYQKLGEYDQALVWLVDLLADNVPRSLKLDAAEIALDCWQRKTPPGYADICGRIGELLAAASSRELRDSRLATLQLGYARAAEQYAAQLDAGDNRAELKRDIDQLKRDAARYAGNVARSDSPLRDEARKLLAEWKISTAESPATSAAPPTTIAEAKAQATALIDAAIDLQRTISSMDVEHHPERSAEAEALSGQLDQTTLEAQKLLALATSLITAETKREDANAILVRRAQVYQLRGEFREAAVIGTYLLERYPTVPGTKDAAQFALNSDLQLFHRAPQEDRDFERQQLTSLSEAMIRAWPGEAASDAAANILVTLAIQNGNLDQALSLLSTMPADSLSRARLETVVGRILWSEYLRESGANSKLDPEKSATLRKAQELLTRGTASFREDNVTPEVAYGILNLAQSYLELQQVEKAIELLETAPLAPLDLIKRKMPVAEDPAFVKDTYRTALRAYIGGMRSGQQSLQLVDKAQSVVNALRGVLSDEGGDSSDRIVAIYYQLARELLSQLQRIQAPQERDSFATSLATFLRSIQQHSRDGKTLMWIGTTLNSVADNLDSDELTATSQAIRAQAVDALKAAAESGFAGDPRGDDLMLELKRQQALALRSQGEYDAALDLLAAVLESKPALINAQIDAAMTLQLKGDKNNSATLLAEAVSGSRASPNAGAGNVIWGWRRIVLATRGKEPFVEPFYESLYNMVYCQFRFGEIQQRRDAREVAMQTIQTQFKQYPEMGGPNFKSRFDELARKIQASLGLDAKGLSATQSP